jgi:hypothetical protein
MGIRNPRALDIKVGAKHRAADKAARAERPDCRRNSYHGTEDLAGYWICV